MNDRGSSMLGRDEERERVAGFLSHPRPAMLLIEGAAGIGKTTLWRHGVDAATGTGFRVLAFRPGEAERSLTLAGLAGLFPDPLLDDVLARIPEARAQALDAALLRSGPVVGDADHRTVGLGVLSVITLLAEQTPVLIALDDLQWLDDPTLRVLEFALRRIESAEVAVLAARRTERVSSAAAPLESAFTDAGRDRIWLGPMSTGALGRLVHDRLGHPLPRPVLARLHQDAGGNPFVALELARAALARGRLPGPGEHFPLTGGVASLLGERIAACGPETREALLAISALAHPTTALLAGVVGDEASERALEELVAAELVRVDGIEVRCSHPLIASAAHSRTLPAGRRRMHARLATVVDDLEGRARHLALAADGPDESVAGTLDEAASLARRRGASDAAAELGELAVSLTPPADLGRRARRELALARHRFSAGSVPGARDAASRAVDLLPPGPGRVDALLLLGRLEAQAMGEVVSGGRRLQQALEEAGDDRAAMVRAHVGAGVWADELRDASGEMEAEHARAALDLLAGHEEEDPTSASAALTMLAEAKFRMGLGLDVELLERALELEPKTAEVRDRASTDAAIGLGIAGMHAESERALQAFLDEAVRRGDWGAQPVMYRGLAWAAWCTGRIAEALRQIERSMEIASEIGLDEGITQAMGAEILAATGRTEQAREWGERAVRRGKDEGFWWWELRGHAANLFIELTGGDVATCADALSTVLEHVSTLGHREPGWDRIEGDAVEALLALGRGDEAEEVTARMEAAAIRGRHPWTRVVSARCRGLLEEAQGRAEEALACFDRALAADEVGEMAFERARTLLAKGRTLRRTNHRRAARDALEESRGIFDSCGAPPWAAKAGAELAAVSGRTSKPTELTTTERRVADLAAAGRTNREIAAELFLSTRTVESHLSAAYRKVGVRSRTELAAALALRRSPD
ncbi:MAG: AAA family ATPase [Actinomycetota bacterium]